MAKVVMMNGDSAGKEILLVPGQTYTVGRQEDCEICIDNVPGVSRHHARFRDADGGWLVEDLDSQNGIYFNDQKVANRSLEDGDILWFSNLSLRFHVDDDAAATHGDVRLTPPSALADELGGVTQMDEESVRKIRGLIDQIQTEFKKVIVGQEKVLEQLLVALFSNGHCLMIGLPGLAKTLMVRTLSDVMDLQFKRIQFTPDLMPSDIIGSDVLEVDEETSKKSFRFIRGPIFTNLLLADEINRTPPKTQAALLEAMQERQVTASNHVFPLPDPFFVLATQNPLEQEGTYPLPEAQLDRFMFNIIVGYPSQDEEEQIVMETTRRKKVDIQPVLNSETLLEIQALVRDLRVSPHVIKYATRLTRATRPEDELAPDYVKENIACGAGPRCAQFLILGAKAKAIMEGTLNVSCQHVRDLVHPIMRHRLFTNFTADSVEMTPDKLISRLLMNVPEPSPREY